MRKRVWNPYLAGALAGVLLMLSVLVAGHFLADAAHVSIF
jgi:hypothetical protein